MARAKLDVEPDIRSVFCPTCQASAGQSCRDAGSAVKWVHVTRVDEFYEANPSARLTGAA
jgi:hypothetical protein